MRISDWSSDVCSSDLEYPASKAERHGKEHRGRAPKGTKCHVEQQKDAREAERHHDRESLRGRLQAFELAAPFEVIARRQLHLRDQIGNASCSADVCQNGSISVASVSLKNKKNYIRRNVH